MGTTRSDISFDAKSSPSCLLPRRRTIQKMINIISATYSTDATTMIAMNAPSVRPGTIVDDTTCDGWSTLVVALVDGSLVIIVVRLLVSLSVAFESAVVVVDSVVGVINVDSVVMVGDDSVDVADVAVVVVVDSAVGVINVDSVVIVGDDSVDVADVVVVVVVVDSVVVGVVVVGVVVVVVVVVVVSAATTGSNASPGRVVASAGTHVVLLDGAH